MLNNYIYIFVILLINIKTCASKEKIFCYGTKGIAASVDIPENIKMNLVNNPLDKKQTSKAYDLLNLPINHEKSFPGITRKDKESLLTQAMKDSIYISKKCAKELLKKRELLTDIRVGINEKEQHQLIISFFNKENGAISDTVKHYLISPKKNYSNEYGSISKSHRNIAMSGIWDAVKEDSEANHVMEASNTTSDQLMSIQTYDLLSQIIDRTKKKNLEEVKCDEGNGVQYTFKCHDIKPEKIIEMSESNKEFKEALIKASNNISTKLTKEKAKAIAINSFSLIGSAIKAALVIYQKKHMEEKHADAIMDSAINLLKSIIKNKSNIKIDLSYFENNTHTREEKQQQSLKILDEILSLKSSQLEKNMMTPSSNDGENDNNAPARTSPITEPN